MSCSRNNASGTVTTLVPRSLSAWRHALWMTMETPSRMTTCWLCSPASLEQ